MSLWFSQSPLTKIRLYGVQGKKQAEYDIDFSRSHAPTWACQSVALRVEGGVPTQERGNKWNLDFGKAMIIS